MKSNMIFRVIARKDGAKVPGRLVSSAKSWLCHPGVDRTAPLLPWAAPPDVPRLSPLEVSARYLRHLVEAWNAARDKAVSLFELELQAEVDKFVTTGLLLRAQIGREPDGLHAWLFDSPTLAAELEEHERDRYRRANRYAARYCQRLTLGRDGEGAAHRELRHFYRLSQASKLAHIDAH